MSFASEGWGKGGVSKVSVRKEGLLCERVHCCELANEI
jgi:hypothetical protein